jgi:hypothetical protein
MSGVGVLTGIGNTLFPNTVSIGFDLASKMRSKGQARSRYQ